MTNYKEGRHAPAFILLFLAQKTAYGSLLLTSMQAELPHCKLDSAVIYRSLQELEKQGAVEAYWDTSEPGPAKKWYKITFVGLEKLDEYKSDIENRMKNLHFFLNAYNEFKRK